MFKVFSVVLLCSLASVLGSVPEAIKSKLDIDPIHWDLLAEYGSNTNEEHLQDTCNAVFGNSPLFTLGLNIGGFGQYYYKDFNVIGFEGVSVPTGETATIGGRILTRSLDVDGELTLGGAVDTVPLSPQPYSLVTQQVDWTTGTIANSENSFVGGTPDTVPTDVTISQTCPDFSLFCLFPWITLARGYFFLQQYVLLNQETNVDVELKNVHGSQVLFFTAQEEASAYSTARIPQSLWNSADKIIMKGFSGDCTSFAVNLGSDSSVIVFQPDVEFPSICKEGTIFNILPEIGLIPSGINVLVENNVQGSIINALGEVQITPAGTVNGYVAAESVIVGGAVNPLDCNVGGAIHDVGCGADNDNTNLLNNNAPYSFNTISEAVNSNHVANGDILLVCPGMYDEGTINITKSLTIRGCNAALDDCVAAAKQLKRSVTPLLDSHVENVKRFYTSAIQEMPKIANEENLLKKGGKNKLPKFQRQFNRWQEKLADQAEAALYKARAERLSNCVNCAEDEAGALVASGPTCATCDNAVIDMRCSRDLAFNIFSSFTTIQNLVFLSPNTELIAINENLRNIHILNNQFFIQDCNITCPVLSTEEPSTADDTVTEGEDDGETDTGSPDEDSETEEPGTGEMDEEPIPFACPTNAESRVGEQCATFEAPTGGFVLIGANVHNVLVDANSFKQGECSTPSSLAFVSVSSASCSISVSNNDFDGKLSTAVFIDANVRSLYVTNNVFRRTGVVSHAQFVVISHNRFINSPEAVAFLTATATHPTNATVTYNVFEHVDLGVTVNRQSMGLNATAEVVHNPCFTIQHNKFTKAGAAVIATSCDQSVNPTLHIDANCFDTTVFDAVYVRDCGLMSLTENAIAGTGGFHVDVCECNCLNMSGNWMVNGAFGAFIHPGESGLDFTVQDNQFNNTLATALSVGQQRQDADILFETPEAGYLPPGRQALIQVSENVIDEACGDGICVEYADGSFTNNQISSTLGDGLKLSNSHNFIQGIAVSESYGFGVNLLDNSWTSKVDDALVVETAYSSLILNASTSYVESAAFSQSWTYGLTLCNTEGRYTVSETSILSTLDCSLIDLSANGAYLDEVQQQLSCSMGQTGECQ